jgi:hypothetical protein
MDDDKKRDLAIYRYLLYCFALVLDESGKPNFRQTAKRFGREGADHAIRIYNDVKKIEQKFGAAKLTTGKLVELLAGLRKHPKIINREDYARLEQLNRYITSTDILKAFQKLIHLSPEEKKLLGIEGVDEEIMLQQALLNIGAYHDRLNQKKILELYEISITTPLSSPTPAEKDTPSRLQVIRTTIEEALQHLPREIISQYLEGLTNTVLGVINRIESQAGVGNLESNQSDFFRKANRNYQENYFSLENLKKITKTIVKNKLLTAEFSVSIKNIKMYNLPPLPLFYEGESQSNSEFLLNHQINTIESLQNKSDYFSEPFQGNQAQEAYQVEISFYIKVPSADGKSMEREDFTITSRGVSGIITQCIKIINRTLFADIKSLETYFPIAHDLFLKQDAIGKKVASVVDAHNFVKLCKGETIKEALIRNLSEKEFISYEKVSFLDEVGAADYYSFDLVEAIVNSALLARLQAIRETGLSPDKYLKELHNWIKKEKKLLKAKNHLTSYPFSLMIMEAEMKEPIKVWQTEEKDEPNQEECDHYVLLEEPTLENYSDVNYKAHLLIVEKYLDEGLYRKAYNYLKAIDHLEIFQKDADLINFNSPPTSQDKDNLKEIRVFSGSLLAYYQFCWAYYFYSLDLEGEIEHRYFDVLESRLKTEGIKKSLEHLEKAEHHLQIRLAKYFIIDEISQGILHPYFSLLAKIYFLKAKIFLFFPREAVQSLKNSENPLNDINYARISLLEKSRIYAARDGDIELYSICNAYQSWAYIMAGYLVPDNPTDKKYHWSQELMKSQSQTQDTYRDKSFKWAKKLMTSALVSYESVGKKAYDVIKEKSGIIKEESPKEEQYINDPPRFEEYANKNLKFQAIPAFNELKLPPKKAKHPTFTSREKQKYEEHILNIDMSLLCCKGKENGKEYKTYLFGTNACHLLFARGVDALVQDDDSDDSGKYFWLNKIFEAYRFFLFSLAIADDSCKIEPETEKNFATSTRSQIKITRNFNDKAKIGIPPEILTIRDLYPHRVSEVVAIAKVYAILCNIILVYSGLAKGELKNKLDEERKYLLDSICSDPRDSVHDPNIVNEQSRFNGYLAPYLERVKKILKSEEESYPKEDIPTLEAEQIKMKRDKLVEEIFLALAEEVS